jgi:hypothetical protein
MLHLGHTFLWLQTLILSFPQQKTGEIMTQNCMHFLASPLVYPLSGAKKAVEMSK